MGGMVGVSWDLTKIILRFLFHSWLFLEFGARRHFFFYEICAESETLVFMFNVKLFTEIVNQISFH